MAKLDLELQIGKRTLKYRLFEILPALLSYGALVLLVVLSIINPSFAAIYLMIIIVTLLVKSVGIAYHTIVGHNRLVGAQKSRLASTPYRLGTPRRGP